MQIHNPKVSIVLLNYNGYEDTIACFESLSKISYSNYNIVIVDNLSPDNSMNDIALYIQNSDFKSLFFETPMHAMEELQQDVKINLIQSGFNGGYGHGNNIGIKYALKNGADYILVLNNDTIVEPDFLNPMVEICENNNNIGICSGKIYYEDRRDIFWFNGGTFNKRTGKVKHVNYNEVDMGQVAPKNVTFITGCLWLIPKNVIKSVGFINEDYFMYVEDLEFTQRVLSAGYTLNISNDAKVYHKVGSSSGGEVTSFSMYWMTKNNLKYMTKNIIFIYWPLYLYNNIISFSLKWVFNGKINLLHSQKKAIFDFFKEMKNV